MIRGDCVVLLRKQHTLFFHFPLLLYYLNSEFKLNFETHSFLQIKKGKKDEFKRWVVGPSTSSSTYDTVPVSYCTVYRYGSTVLQQYEARGSLV